MLMFMSFKLNKSSKLLRTQNIINCKYSKVKFLKIKYKTMLFYAIDYVRVYSKSIFKLNCFECTDAVLLTFMYGQT